jgi:hypothetical protein
VLFPALVHLGRGADRLRQVGHEDHHQERQGHALAVRQPDAEDRLLGDAVEQAAKRQRQPGYATGADCPLLHGTVGEEEDESSRGQADGEGPGPGRVEPAAGELEGDTRDQRADAEPQDESERPRVPRPRDAEHRADEERRRETAPQKRLAPIPALRANRRLPPSDSSGSARYVGRMSAARGSVPGLTGQSGASAPSTVESAEAGSSSVPAPSRTLSPVCPFAFGVCVPLQGNSRDRSHSAVALHDGTTCVRLRCDRTHILPRFRT